MHAFSTLFSTHSFSSISSEMVHLEKIVKGYKELTAVDTVNSSKDSSMSKNSHLLRGLYLITFRISLGGIEK